MSRSRPKLVLASTVAFALLSIATEARAFPTFARQYQVGCATCHTTITRRNEFGDAFRKAGYRWPVVDDASKPEGQPSVELGAAGGVLGVLPSYVPVAAVATISAAYSDDPELDPKAAAKPPSVKILFGAPFGEHLSILGKWSLPSAPSELFVHAARIADSPVNLLVGQFEPTTTLFRENDALLDDFIITATTITGHKVSEPRLGAELNSILGDRTFIAVGGMQNNTPDSYVDGYYHLSHKFGGMSMRGVEPDIDLLAEPSAFEEMTLTLAQWGYLGRSLAPGAVDLAEIQRLGFDVKIASRELTLWGGVMLGLDHNLFVDRPAHSFSGFIEIGYAVTAWLWPMYIYQFQDSATYKRQHQRHAAGFLIAILENARLRLVARHVDEFEIQRREAEVQLLVGF
jgi:hypothetical protein